MPFVKELVLASTSVFRRELLEKSGLSFSCRAPLADEKTLQHPEPRELALGRSRLKALSLSATLPEALVIGADQTLSWQGQLLEKVDSREEAFACLSRLAGTSYTLHSGLCLAYWDGLTPSPQVLALTSVDSPLSMRPLSPEEIQAYVATDEWQGVVGCNRIEGRGIHLHAPTYPLDTASIIGLPLAPLLELLRTLGINGLLQAAPPWELKIELEK